MKIYGNIMLGEKFFVGTVEIEEGRIENIVEKKEKYDFKGTVIPTFINMHTHIGDFYYPNEPQGTLEEVVGPDGLKYKILKNKREVLKGMRKAMRIMERCGVSHFVDFREGGKEGVELILKASRGLKIRPIILARGDLWENADGISISSAEDVGFERALMLSQKAHKYGKFFALHASENRRENVESILALNPDFIVHMLMATESDLLRVKKAGIPIILTPRANAFWGMIPDVVKMVSIGIKIALGTDNGMIALPCIFREMEFTYLISRLQKRKNLKVSPEDIIRMVTSVPREILGIQDNRVGSEANLIVFKKLMTPYEIVTKASCRDIRYIVVNAESQKE